MFNIFKTNNTERKELTTKNLLKEINYLREILGESVVGKLANYKILLEEGEPDYITIAQQNLEYYRKVGDSINENKGLKIENELLQNKIQELKDLNLKTTQENAVMDKHIKELENDLDDYYKIQDKLLDKYEDSYNERMMVAALEKTTDDKETYKKIINELCDRYDIEHSEVFSIIDNIKKEKCNKDIQIEK